jgi:hypothetical protein
LATKVVETEVPLPLRLPVNPKLALPVPIANNATRSRKSERTLSSK